MADDVSDDDKISFRFSRAVREIVQREMEHPAMQVRTLVQAPTLTGTGSIDARGTYQKLLGPSGQMGAGFGYMYIVRFAYAYRLRWKEANNG